MKLRAKFTRILTFLQAEVAREMIIKVVKLRLLINIRKQKKGKYVSIDASEMLSDLFIFFHICFIIIIFSLLWPRDTFHKICPPLSL